MRKRGEGERTSLGRSGRRPAGSKLAPFPLFVLRWKTREGRPVGTGVGPPSARGDRVPPPRLLSVASPTHRARPARRIPTDPTPRASRDSGGDSTLRGTENAESGQAASKGGTSLSESHTGCSVNRESIAPRCGGAPALLLQRGLSVCQRDSRPACLSSPGLPLRRLRTGRRQGEGSVPLSGTWDQPTTAICRVLEPPCISCLEPVQASATAPGSANVEI